MIVKTIDDAKLVRFGQSYVIEPGWPDPIMDDEDPLEWEKKEAAARMKRDELFAAVEVAVAEAPNFQFEIEGDYVHLKNLGKEVVSGRWDGRVKDGNSTVKPHSEIKRRKLSKEKGEEGTFVEFSTNKVTLRIEL